MYVICNIHKSKSKAGHHFSQQHLFCIYIIYINHKSTYQIDCHIIRQYYVCHLYAICNIHKSIYQTWNHYNQQRSFCISSITFTRVQIRQGTVLVSKVHFACLLYSLSSQKYKSDVVPYWLQMFVLCVCHLWHLLEYKSVLLYVLISFVICEIY